MLDTLLGAVGPFLNEVIDQLAVTAKWKGQNRGAEPGSPSWLLRGAASSIASALAMTTEADLTILRAYYGPPPDLDALLKKALPRPVCLRPRLARKPGREQPRR